MEAIAEMDNVQTTLQSVRDNIDTSMTNGKYNFITLYLSILILNYSFDTVEEMCTSNSLFQYTCRDTICTLP